MTATQRAVVDDLGNINIHGRSGLVIVWKVKNAEGSYIDISASDLFFEISGKIRIELTAGDDVYSRKASLTRTQIATLPLNQALAYALHDETPSSPCTIWSGLITAYGFKTAPSGAAAVDPGTASWSGATVTVQQGESVPTVVVTYMGATGYGVPTGGTSGQYLRKNSATEFDWGFDTITSADVSGLDGQLAAKADKSITVTGGGLATGGGDLSDNRTITVTAATLAEAQAGSASNVVLTPERGTDLLNARRGAAGGVASLDGSSLVPVAQIPALPISGITNLQAALDAKQDLHANLTAFSGLSLVADSLPYANRTGTLAMATLTAAGRALLDDDDAPAMRTTLGLGTAAVQDLSSMAAMTMAGVLAFVAGTAALPGLAVAGDLNTGIYGVSADVLGVSAGGLNAASFSNGQLSLATAAGGAGVNLAVDGANALALRNGVNAQAFRVYNTYTDGSNYERVAVEFSGNIAYLRTAGAGTGQQRGIVISGETVTAQTGGTSRWALSAAGHTAASAANAYDWGSSSFPFRTGYFGTNVVIGYSTTSTAQLHVGPGNNPSLPDGGGVNRTPQVNHSQTVGYAMSSVGVNDGTNNYRAGLFVNHTNALWGLAASSSTGGVPFVINNGGTEILRITAAGVATLYNNLLFSADNSYDIGASGANRPRSVYTGGTIYSGNGYYLIGTGRVEWGGRSLIQSPVDGVLALYNNALTGFTGIKLGGVSSAFPYIKVNGAEAQFRLADDSGFTKVQGQLKTHANAVAETPTATHTLTLYDASGTAYRVLCCV